MSMHLPLTVRVKTKKMDKHITRDLRDLSFRSTAPGGYASATFTLDRPLLLQPDEIAYYGTVYVYDGRHGGVVWEGRLEDQGRSSGADGEVWQLSAVGPSAHAQDGTLPLIYVDRRLSDVWQESNFNLIKTASIDFGDEVAAALKMTVPRGTVATIGFVSDVVDVTYTALRVCEQKLARVSFTHVEGPTSPNWRVKLLTRLNDGISSGALVDDPSSTTSVNRSAVYGAANWGLLDNVCNLRYDRDDTSATVTNDDTWTKISNVVVRAMLKNAAGGDITTGYTTDTILASQVVNDLLGRVLNMYDGANASVETTSYGIEQLAFDEGATAAEIFEKLMEFEPAYYWAAWESNSAGEHRFEWKAWPTHVRYEATTHDGFDAPSTAAELYNKVTVIWSDANGKRQRLSKIQIQPDLDQTGITREHLITLGEGGTQANADQVATEFLAEHKFPPNAGALTVARPILDRDAGRMVMPWEIKPGHLIRVRNVQPRIDSLNATDRDGVSVFRIVSVNFSTGSAVATLELDSYSRTVARALADLGRTRSRWSR